MILPLELLHGFTFAGTLTAVSDFAMTVLPTEDQAQGENLVFSLRGWFMVAGLVIASWTQQIYGPQFLYREASRMIFLATGSFMAALLLERLLTPATAKSRRASRNARDRDKKKLNPYCDEECGKAQRRPATDDSDLFQDVGTRDFDLTISVNTGLDESEALDTDLKRSTKENKAIASALVC